MRNGFGLYKEPTEHRNKIVKDFFKDLENTKEKYANAKVKSKSSPRMVPIKRKPQHGILRADATVLSNGWI